MNKAVSFLSLLLLIITSCSNNKSWTNNPQLAPQPVAFGKVTVDRDSRLGKRAMANFMRLERGRYLPDSIYVIPSPEYHQTDWPGDVPGRLVLGQTLLQEATGRPAEYLNAIVKDFPAHMNGKGYFGHDYGSMINEQQLSGHGWTLRGLCEYYLMTKDSAVLKMITTMVDSLVLPTKGEHSLYPIDPASRKDAGGYMGTSQNSLGNWILSSDIGCDFIFMDGVIQAYAILGTPELKEISREMIDRFIQIDLVGIKAQTHSTLTALRGLVRYYSISGDTAVLNAAERRYRIYREQGMTENFENYNWFGRPLWTEPCAVVDAYILSVQLWQYTGKSVYLADAQKMWYNGIGFEQRYNGGFGCNSCLGNHGPYSDSTADPFLTVSVTESHWCCTMRGGEGLARAIEYSYFTQGNTVFVPDFHAGTAEFDLPAGSLSVSQITNYPYDTTVVFQIDESRLNEDVTLSLFIPAWISHPFVKINGEIISGDIRNGFLSLQRQWKKGDHILLGFDLMDEAVSNRNVNSIKGYHSFWHGPLMLGHPGADEISLPSNTPISPTGENQFMAGVTPYILRPVNHLMDSAVTKENNYSIQVLFRD